MSAEVIPLGSLAFCHCQQGIATVSLNGRLVCERCHDLASTSQKMIAPDLTAKLPEGPSLAEVLEKIQRGA